MKGKSPTPRPVCDGSPQVAVAAIPDAPENHTKTNSSVSPINDLLTKKLQETELQLVKSRKDIRILQQKTRIFKRKNDELCSVIRALEEKKHVSEKSLSALEFYVGGVNDLVKRLVANNNKKKKMMSHCFFIALM